MTHSKLLKIGAIGTIISAICCFTPLLVLLFGVIGLSSFVGMLDIILLPALTIFILMTGLALWKRHQQK